MPLAAVTIASSSCVVPTKGKSFDYLGLVGGFILTARSDLQE